MIRPKKLYTVGTNTMKYKMAYIHCEGRKNQMTFKRTY